MTILALLCAGGGVAAYYVLYPKFAGVAEASKTTKVVTPENLSGKAKITNADLTTTLDKLKATAQKQVPNSTGAVAAAYGDLSKSDIVMVTALSGTVANPQAELDALMKGVGSSTSTLSDVATIDAGPLGGVAKCGKLTNAQTKFAVCGWADNGSVGLVLWYEKDLTIAKNDFQAIRAQIEEKS